MKGVNPIKVPADCSPGSCLPVPALKAVPPWTGRWVTRRSHLVSDG